MTSYRYNVLGNLWQVTLPNGAAIDYLIDGQNGASAKIATMYWRRIFHTRINSNR
ncbi:hypothetical protein [Methylobacter sp.]|uniref:hypothetical protein n=1 Tax=Methylobacter sp. TaxID=2051955 RepID=UPI002FDD81C5